MSGSLKPSESDIIWESDALTPSESNPFWVNPSANTSAQPPSFRNPSTPQALTAQQDESQTNAPMNMLKSEQIEEACKKLRLLGHLTLHVSESQYMDTLALFWSSIYETVTYDRALRANFIGFKDNVQLIGEARLLEVIRNAAKNDTWEDFLHHNVFFSQKSDKRGRIVRNEMQSMDRQRLSAAYNHPFRGEAATHFINHLTLTEDEVKVHKAPPIYAKAISVLQSSGTGKSRMLTEVGRKVFTLPICLRYEHDPGYPPSDVVVFDYFSKIPKHNDQSFTAHVAIACFLAAAHGLMYEYLKKAQETVENLLMYWNGIMEPKGAVRDERNTFFAQVVEQANDLKMKNISLLKEVGPRPDSKTRDPDDYIIPTFAEICYNTITKKSTEQLMDFLSIIQGDSPCITYFDEAHQLEASFWVLLRIAQCHAPTLRLCPSNVLSLKLWSEMCRLLPPYIALGYDQHAIAESRKGKTVKLCELQSIEHLAQYGRPLWKAQLPEKVHGEMIDLASTKLTDGLPFEASNKDHVFAVFSQRFCLDPSVAGAEALQLADRSVAHYMRLLTGFSPKLDLFYTQSPSEPVLVLGAANILYHSKAHENRLRTALRTLSIDLCSAGLVDKGIMGELVARILLLVARDYAAPWGERGPNLLQPVPVLHFLNTLFGADNWAGQNRYAFNEAFKDAHVNFTHWLMTKDPMPQVPDKDLLANLWARGAALQCCFNQHAIDFIIPIYYGKIDASAPFDPSKLSTLSGQVKFKNQGDGKAESAIRPIGIPRDIEDPPPYLALLIELGSESNYKETCSKLKSSIPSPLIPGNFQCLTNGIARSEAWLAQHEDQKPLGPDNGIDIAQLREAVEALQREKDSYNRFSLSVRGSSAEVYGVLAKADIVSEFHTLLKVTMPPPNPQDKGIQHMQPCQRLGIFSEHNAWMSEYSME